MLRVYVPVYNEGERVIRNIGLIQDRLSRMGCDYQLIIVDDSSTDGSSKLVEELARENGRIIVKSYANGPSRRENLAQAMLSSADDDMVCFIDADLSPDLALLPELVHYVESGYDIAIASRYMGIKPKRRMMRLLTSQAYNRIIQLVFSSKIRDHQCGFKAFKGRVVKSLIREAGYDSTLFRGWFWDAEILIRAQKDNYRIMEFPSGWSEGSATSFNLRREFRIVSYMLRFRMRV